LRTLHFRSFFGALCVARVFLLYQVEDKVQSRLLRNVSAL